MKKKYAKIHTLCSHVILLLTLMIQSSSIGQTFSDNATNYSGTWANCSNFGIGFGFWSSSYGANTSSFIGSPGNNCIEVSNNNNKLCNILFIKTLRKNLNNNCNLKISTYEF
jgi:hypothetical protein